MSAESSTLNSASASDLEKNEDPSLSPNSSVKDGINASGEVEVPEPSSEKKVDKEAAEVRINGIESVVSDTDYPSGLRFVALTSALCITISLVALDSTIVSTAIPTLVGKWDSLKDLGWYGSAYLLPQPTLQPSFGKAYPYFNTKYLFLSVGSLVCSLANSSVDFILGRTVAGIGAAIIAPGMMLILIDTVPKPKRPLYTGLLAAAAGVAACLGPFVGGVFTTHVTWRWCFWINLPLGLLACTMLLFFYSPKSRKQGTPIKEIVLSLDPFGCILLTGSVVCLLLALTFAAESTWSTPRVIALLVLFVVLLAGLAVWQRIAKPGKGLLPGRVLRNKGIVLCALFGFLVEVGSTSHVYYLPFYFQGVKGASAAGSGVDLLPYLLSQTLAAVVAGAAINRSGYFNPPMLAGTVMFSIGAGLLHTLSTTTPSSMWIGYQILAGFGTGCAQFMAMGIAQQLLEKEDESIGLSMVYMIKTLGSAIAVSVCSTIFYSSLRSDLQAAGLNQAEVSQVLLSLNHLGGATSSAMKSIAATAIANAISMVFYVPVGSGVLAWVIAVVTRWKKIQKAEEK
ncbi:hypothetical protein BP5796_02049 [Coleophoma crateriformis]|uniref:Major facilitator superfamily (MFS) profile domain-containing protein n=1 Tax=Coleophoma crateriformis TaxID=565419 RepID=A0A3D8T257_9HELO|nr:hypothetical protein BP5796_02049 [Coleophoma crateriformis]